jgi:hypothetical protein
MRLSSKLRVAFLALTALIGISLSSMAVADSGTVRITVVKAGWVIGGSAGSGVLYFRGRSYPLSIGGLSYGLTFGASKIEFHGRVTNIWRPSDVEGVYAAGGAGAALGRGAGVIVLTNPKGAVLELTGQQVGLIVSLDLNGLALTLR